MKAAGRLAIDSPDKTRYTRGGVPLALLLAAVIAGLDLVTESAVGVGFLVLAPLVVAARGGSTVQTGAVATLVTVMAILLGIPDHIFGERLHIVLVLFEIFGGGLAVYVSLLRAQREDDSRSLAVQFEVSRALQESRTLGEAAPRLLEILGRSLDWDAAGLWEAGPPHVLDCVDTWTGPAVQSSSLEKLRRRFVIRKGVGLPGRVFESGEPMWTPNLSENLDSPRSELATDAGLRAAAWVPLRTSTGIVGMIELFARDPRDQDESALKLLTAVGGQVGEFVEVRRAETALRKSEARKGSILESALDGVITMDHEGRVVEFNPAAERIFGYSGEEVIGRELADLIVPPDLREAHRTALARYLETGHASIIGSRVELRAIGADGVEFPVELGVNAIGDTDPPMFTGYVRDISERRRAEEERERLLGLERLAREDADRAREQLAAILSGVADGVTAQGPNGELIFANEMAVRTLGATSVEELLETPPEELRDRFEILGEDGEPFPPSRHPGQLALGGEVGAEALLRYVDLRDGAEQWSRVKATPIFGERSEVLMAISVMEDVTELKRGEQAQRLLAEAGRVLSSSMNTEKVLDRIANLVVVPWLADWCSVHMIRDGGDDEMVAHASVDEEGARILLELSERFPQAPDSLVGVPVVLRTGESRLIPEVTTELIESEIRDEEHRSLVVRAAPRSALVCPIASRGRVLGALTLLRLGSGRRYDEEDLTLIDELGRRVGVAADHARLYAERSYIAKTLQESLLPAQLPDIPGLETAARFRAAGEGNEVGGDFYDLFESGGGDWSVVIGDVCGKGPDAAALTALARYTLRAAAMRDPGPSAGLRVLNEALLLQRADVRFATVAYANLSPGNGRTRVDISSAGHPLPLLLRKDGTVEAVGAPGTLVGVVPDPDLGDASTHLEPGDALVFYTDGVTEARNENGVLGERRLGEIVRSCAGLGADAIADRIERAAVELQEGETRDDIAVLVLRALSDVDGLPKGG